MTLSLNIYGKGGKIEKTYTCNDYELQFGTIEDIVSIIDFDKLFEKSDKVDLSNIISDFVAKAMDEVKRLLLDIFPECSGKELRKAHVSDIINIIISVVMFSLSGLSFGKSKN